MTHVPDGSNHASPHAEPFAAKRLSQMIVGCKDTVVDQLAK
jgi:hypothetical protein